MLKLSENPPILPASAESVSSLPGEWWVAHTKARFEKALAWDLLHREIGYFLPMIEKTSLWGGRKRKILMPVFPSYVFFCGTSIERASVLSTGRVCQVIPVRDRASFVGELTAVERALSARTPLDFYPFAAVGRRCRVVRGPLEGIEGTVERRDNVTRLVLSVSILGQGASLEIDADLLESVD